jgi:hypothetical protein
MGVKFRDQKNHGHHGDINKVIHRHLSLDGGQTKQSACGNQSGSLMENIAACQGNRKLRDGAGALRKY